MIKILVIDDDVKAINLLKLYIQNYFSQKKELYTLNSFESAESFLYKGDNLDYDLILLDIEMPNLNGIELAKKIRKNNTKVVIAFITGYQKYISESYKIHPFDYLLKPINQRIINDFFDEYFMYHIDKNIKKNLLSFNTTRGTIGIERNNIIFFEYIDTSSEYLNRSTKIVTKQGIYIMKEQIGIVFKSLDNFVFSQPHRSFIVNLENIKSFNNNEIVMINGQIIPISQRKIKILKKQFNEYINAMLKEKLWY